MKKINYKFARNALIITSLLSGSVATFILVKKARNELQEKNIKEQLRQNVKIKHVFDAAKSRLQAGDIEQIEASIQKLPKEKLNRTQIFEIYTILAQVKIQKLQKSYKKDERNRLFNEAIFYLKEANDYVEMQSIQNALLYYYGKLYIATENYADALENFASIHEHSRLSKFEKDMLNIYIGDCYFALKDYRTALQFYETAANDKNNSCIILAKRKAAQIYAFAAKKPQIFEGDSKLNKEQVANLTEKNRQQGEELYKQILADKNSSLDEFASAKVGLFAINLNSNDEIDSYSAVNSILNSTFDDSHKVEALFALAIHEEEKNNIQQAINIMHGALTNYRRIASAKGAYIKLYNYYKDMGDWDGAFSMAKELLNDPNNFKTLVYLSNDFASDDNPLFKMLENEKKVDAYIKALEDIISIYKTQMPREWQQIKFQTNFIIAQSAFRIANYKLSQKYLNEFYLESFPDNETAEKVLFLDINLAKQQKLSPVVIISRCLRYFSNVNKGENYKEVMAVLLDNYYKCGLYSEAINTAKKIYLDELKQLTTQGKSQKIAISDKNWLRTVAKIGQCYAKRGDYYQSDLILKQYSLDFLNKDYATDIYIDWAKVSSALQQYYEARRRYDIAWVKTEDDNQKLKIDIERLLLDFKYRKFLENFYNDSNALLDLINNSKNNFTNEEKKNYSRLIYEAMLELALEKHDSLMYSKVLERIMNLYGSDYWPGYWALRDIINEDGENDINVILKNSKMYIKKIPQKTELQKKYLQIVQDQVDIINNLNQTKDDIASIKKELGL
ncbi:hypothetical protein AAEX28_14870 [Lentisphaerota bacterium WC36G]|nr:hypothetical protein LJT99_01625 [Lentisphaerae bacterium WC36]